jgi:Rrf2 family protein
MKSLLKVTSRARLGLILVSELALLKKGERLSLEEVARKAGASRKFLEQIAGELRRAGLVDGLRGAAGGYRLTRDPSGLAIAEVLNAVEGPMDPEDCTAHSHKTDTGILSKVQGQVMATLMNTTLADII